MSQVPPPLPPELPPANPPPLPANSSHQPCPNCGAQESQPVKFTWWGGVIGPKLFTHVKCPKCGTAYNGKTGRPNTTAIIIYSVVLGIAAAVGMFFLIRGMT